jgi:hypothetical protein
VTIDADRAGGDTYCIAHHVFTSDTRTLGG